jgi:hypothetical protein
MTEPQHVAEHNPTTESITLLQQLETVDTTTDLLIDVVDTDVNPEEHKDGDSIFGEEDQNDLDDLDEIEFLLDEIEDQIAPLAL